MVTSSVFEEPLRTRQPIVKDINLPVLHHSTPILVPYSWIVKPPLRLTVIHTLMVTDTIYKGIMERLTMRLADFFSLLNDCNYLRLSDWMNDWLRLTNWLTGWLIDWLGLDWLDWLLYTNMNKHIMATKYKHYCGDLKYALSHLKRWQETTWQQTYCIRTDWIETEYVLSWITDRYETNKHSQSHTFKKPTHVCFVFWGVL